MIDLQKFSAVYDLRSWLRQPWAVGEYTYATDAAIIVRASRAEYPADDLVAGMGEKTDNILARLNAVLPDMAPIPAIPPGPHYRKCWSCKGAGEIHFCPKCQGEGCLPHYQEDSEDTYPDCHHCHGTGTLPEGPSPVECEDCEGEGVQEVPTYVRFGARILNAKYLRLIKALPNARLALNGEGDAAHFVFDGGCGFVMPCREDGEVLDLTPQEATP